MKYITKAMKAITTEPKYKEGSNWSIQLIDNAEPVATHVHCSIRQCEQNPEKLKTHLSSVVKHYKNEHDDCAPLSRCKIDNNYEPSRVVMLKSYYK